VVQAVDVTNFISASSASSKALKTATLLKSLTVNALIIGESGVGKKSLASFILPDASVVDASNFKELLSIIETSSELIITNIDESPNLKILLNAIVDKGIRVIATSKISLNHEDIDELFSVKFDILPLVQRKEDIKELMQLFFKEASSLFGGQTTLNLASITPDLNENSHSLRRQIMINYLLKDIKDVELIGIMERFLAPKLGSNNDYKSFLYLFEVPLIKAGLKKFKSQLQLADRLGLNRNTLRKKIADNKQYLEG